MPRSIRIEYPGAYYHVMARGNRREAIFFNDDDRRFFLKTLSDACARTGWCVHAWVLMNNHYHLMLQTPEANLVEGMKWLQNTYTRRLNAKHHLWGRVFGDRYKSVLVDGGSGYHFTTLMDYIHLNPVRAGCVKLRKGGSVMDYPWSSVRTGYACIPGKRPEWSCVKEGLAAFGFHDTAAGRRKFVERLDVRAREERAAGVVPLPPMADARLSHLRRGWYWGTQAFAEKTMRMGKALMLKRRNATYRSGTVNRAHDAQRAEELLAQGLKRLGLGRQELESLPGSDPRKLAIAWLLFTRTSVRQGWIAAQLRMKSAANVSQQLGRLRGGAHSLPYQKAIKKLSELFD